MGSFTGGSATSKGKTSDQASTAAIQLAQQFANESAPVRQNLISTFNEMLTTGGSRLPVFAQAEEQSRMAASKASSDTSNQLAQSGLSGTPFGQTIMANQTQAGNQAAAQTRNEIFMNLLGQIQPFVLGQSGNAGQTVTGAVGGNTKSKGTSHGISASGGK